MKNQNSLNLAELKEIRANIDAIIEGCAKGEIDRDEMYAQIWMHIVLNHPEDQIMH